MTEIVLIAVGFLAGFYAKRIYQVCRSIRSHFKYGVCFRYRPTGKREWREGTISDFCRRCGHPAGYHGFKE